MTEVRVGQPVDVTLAGWPAGVVSVALCGAGAAAGSADCATAQSTVVVVGEDGTGTGTLLGVAPPSSCPCVVRATTLTGQVTATLPVVVPDVATGAVAPRPMTVVPTSRLVVAAAAERVGGWRGAVVAALGGPADYRVAVTVQNAGDLASTARTVDVVAGRDSLGGEVVGRLDVAAVDPGDALTRELVVRVPAPLAGAYVLHGELDPADHGSVFVAEVESWPVVPAAVVLFLAAWLLLRRRVLRAVAVTALVGALVVAGHWGLTRWLEHSRAERAQAALLAGFAPALTSDETPAAPAEPVTGDLVGVLRIPALDGLQLAVVEGVVPEQLRRGPGHYPGTALPGQVGNVVVAGHNARSGAGAPFVDLHELVAGDEIRFETPQGTWTYTVTGTRVVPPAAVSVLLPVRDRPQAVPTTSQLTLVTCDYSLGGSTNRLVVEAELAEAGPAGRAVGG
ncbi:class E sortase [Xylanimonas protaetiae]|uniref:Class E sortase n=1 Tax=Xylanimonas protaetiae TaxID=2509457 RepID=A0A4P6F8Q6_9MICO|nr:class E sortase [Xylanimonas protaetiae]QAY71273.1 class E sortase [Xylanimonas protaetiae]